MENATKNNLLKKYEELLDSTSSDEIKAKYKRDISDKNYKQVIKLFYQLKDDIIRVKLRKIFYEYLELLKNNGDILEFLNKYELKSKQSMYNTVVMRYLNNYASEEEKKNYDSIPKGNDPDIAREKYILCINEEYSKLTRMMYDKDENQVFEYYNEHKISIRILKEYILENYQDEKERTFLLSKLERYIEFHNSILSANRTENIQKPQNNKKQELIDKKSELIEDIIKSGNSSYTYCKAHGMESCIVQKFLLYIKKYDLKRYNRYVELLNQNKASEDKRNAALALTMENMIENGVEEDNYIRNFDIVDYYMMVKIEPKDFIKSAQDYLKSPLQIINLKKILLNSYNETEEMPFNEENELNQQNIVLIDGTSRLITREEKQGFIDYLKSNNIPINNCTYKTMKIRFTNLLTKRNIKMKTYS